METLPRDSAPEKSVDRRLPLRIVHFHHAVPAPGMKQMVTQMETGATRIDQGIEVKFPQVYLDPILRTVSVGQLEYPFESVVCWERAKMAIGKTK